eukprot:TRINITY_DN93251_c0_g1_i1.p1 TRINITY_DN93251_c0_g1~~TRINITY_DN93251_c0_g1_i1.p1  ORF type:complete len:436 (-),score=67.20 TRINITY_DN93251_c0_g1_i1:43-1272(-)
MPLVAEKHLAANSEAWDEDDGYEDWQAEADSKEDASAQRTLLDKLLQSVCMLSAQATVVASTITFVWIHGEEVLHVVNKCADQLDDMGACTLEFDEDCIDDMRKACTETAQRLSEIPYFSEVVLVLWLKFGANMAWSYSIGYHFLKKNLVVIVFYVLNAILLAGLFLSTPPGSKERITSLPLLVLGSEVVCIALLLAEALSSTGQWYYKSGLRLRFLVLLMADLLIGSAMAYFSWLLAAEPQYYPEQRWKASQLLGTVKGVAALVAFVYVWCCWWADDAQWRGEELICHSSIHLTCAHAGLVRQIERFIFYGFIYAAMVTAMASEVWLLYGVLLIGGPLAVLRVVQLTVGPGSIVRGDLHDEDVPLVSNEEAYESTFGMESVALGSCSVPLASETVRQRSVAAPTSISE